MASNTLHLEVRKADGAILSYFLERPDAQSETVDYVQVTQDELTYLNLLEDNILPAGTALNLTHLETHRSRVTDAKATKAAQHTAVAHKAAQKPSQSVTAASNKDTQNKARTFKAGFKPVSNPRK
ncbi:MULTISPECIES: hypothetical protein [unclassified Pseudomonas]|uniref:hypothetical protein n=1 Tax=unclassified Pseudomonas TaxID=196821 RepID=UPI000B6FE128|nr:MULTISPECIES: hypothetical protein [unclassified Pseudomonas]SNT22957.1 hypothetical protein SAMN05660216_03144 [Pseudomonas sp. LAMO17WK12:I8]SNY27738.1 hypothetical protein SAMN05660344_03070 [Pseudomonas sp. LAMO17WK12:I11]SNY27921.1 hypothetical protein SAMN05660893_03088 [Pseudomonas sp. LAMO17WK12:I12]SNY28183.1 hypothetical protein SAMN05660700_03145 [Pseudomonas sp. LAMO17WK12:I7]